MYATSELALQAAQDYRRLHLGGDTTWCATVAHYVDVANRDVFKWTLTKGSTENNVTISPCDPILGNAHIYKWQSQRRDKSQPLQSIRIVLCGQDHASIVDHLHGGNAWHYVSKLIEARLQEAFALAFNNRDVFAELVGS